MKKMYKNKKPCIQKNSFESPVNEINFCRRNSTFRFNFIFSLVFILFFVLSFVPFGFSQDVNSYDYLKVKIENKLEFDIDFQRDYKVDKFEVSSYTIPSTYEDSQYLNSYSSSYDNFKIINESEKLFFRFFYDINTLQTKNVIRNEFILESTRFEPEINSKIKYPLSLDVQKQNTMYLDFKGLIDIDSDIRDQASKLADGEDDTYIIAAKIAKWIREDINYDLSTVTENPNQKSTDVFKSKAGVCKEISNLYISMMRSLGIPARVVTGYAYTDSAELVSFLGDNWGGHAWVEVLIGDTWVPFDLTYNQFGYVDATHIIIDKGSEVQNNGFSFSYMAYGIEIEDNSKISNSFEILDKQNLNQPKRFTLSVEGPQELGFGSYGYIKVKIKNIEDKYNILFLALSKVNEVELYDLDKQMVVFKPNEEKEIYFRYKITDSLDSRYYYTFPFEVYEYGSLGYKQSFEVSVRSDYNTIKKIALPEVVKEETELSDNDVMFDCNFIMDAPKNMILCSAKNPNNYEISNMEVCMGNSCNRIDLKLNEQKSIVFETVNYDETITYKYLDKEGSFDLKISKPIFNLSHNVSGNSLFVEYEIENYANNIKVNIYINDTLFMSLNDEYSKLKIPLNYGENDVRINMDIGNMTIDRKIFKLTIEKPLPEKTFFAELIDLIKSFFTWG